MPFLLPPPEFRSGELSQLGLTGTCELQIVRSAGPWSMGTPGKIEQSVQNAYLKAIQMSEHFVYIENQFFITSTTVDDVKIENRIGDAIVQRIIRAHHDKTPWKCCILIPLLPGFTFPVDHSDASAPDEYISVLSLRNWGKMRDDVLVTEQVYIHAKVCIVDDRLVIIGSANINERSQRGDRDSELAAVIRDTDLIDCTMAGKPFKVGRFAHSLRVRLMREHLGIDVDALDEEDLMAHDPVKPEYEQKAWDPNSEQTVGCEEGFTQVQGSQGNASRRSNIAKFAATGIRQAAHGGAESLVSGVSKITRASGGDETAKTGDEDIDHERKDYNVKGEQVTGFASSVVPTQEEKTLMEGRPHKENTDKSHHPHGLQQDVITEEEEGSDYSADQIHSEARTLDGESYGAPANAPKDDAPPRPSADLDNEQQRGAAEARSTLRKHLSVKSSNWGVPTPRPKVHPDDFEDPIIDSFWKEKWIASATHNTEIYRKVFHAVPDDLITTWKQYKDFVAHHERFARPVPPTNDRGGPSESEEESGLGHDDGISSESSTKEGHEDVSVDTNHQGLDSKMSNRKPAKGTEAFERWEREELLKDLNGHLVIYPTRFLEGEDIANNFLFNADRLLPLPIYD
ncbi:hypothetical protein H1R20_g4455, partial [Candolleomyces eurysporus]